MFLLLQGILEFMYPDDRFHVSNDDREYDIFGHGGMMFLFTSSIFFFVVSSLVIILYCADEFISLAPLLFNWTRKTLQHEYSMGPFKCYVTLVFWKLDPHPPPRNANNIEHYTFVTLFFQKVRHPPPPSALRNT